jgi:ribosomal protein S17
MKKNETREKKASAHSDRQKMGKETQITEDRPKPKTKQRETNKGKTIDRNKRSYQIS